MSSSSSLPSQLVLDGSASTTATVTPSLTDLQAATQANADKTVKLLLLVIPSKQ